MRRISEVTHALNSGKSLSLAKNVFYLHKTASPKSKNKKYVFRQIIFRQIVGLPNTHQPTESAQANLSSFQTPSFFNLATNTAP